MQSMRSWSKTSLLAGLVLTGCMAAERNKPAAMTTGTADKAQAYAGWYMEHGGQGMFQPCGQSQSWRLSRAGDLPARAKAFGLQPDTPLYVRVTGTVRDNALAVASIEQVGSPTPVHDCGLTGVVLPSTTP